MSERWLEMIERTIFLSLSISFSRTLYRSNWIHVCECESVELREMTL